LLIKQRFGLVFKDYMALHRWSCDEKETFWQSIIDFFGVKLDLNQALPYTAGDAMWQGQWFLGAKLNYAENLLQAVITESNSQFGSMNLIKITTQIPT
jgi:acetoacetyl-CoA synthetase